MLLLKLRPYAEIKGVRCIDIDSPYAKLFQWIADLFAMQVAEPLKPVFIEAPKSVWATLHLMCCDMLWTEW